MKIRFFWLALAAVGFPAFAGAPVLETEAQIRASRIATVQLGDERVRFDVTAERRGGVTQIRGRDPQGRFLLLTDTGEGMTGSVVGPGGEVLLAPTAAAKAAVAGGRVTDRLKDDVITLPSPKRGVEAKTNPDPNEDRVDIIVLYTSRLRDEIGIDEIYARAFAFMNRLSASFENSNLPYSAELVAIALSTLTDSYETGTPHFALQAITERGNTEAVRQRFGADLVVFFRASAHDQHQIAGSASGFDGRSVDECRDYCAYAVVNATSYGWDITGVHEVGHLFGGGHEQPERGWNQYSSAYKCTRSAGHFDFTTSAVGIDGFAAPVFSSPLLVNESGVPCGNAQTGDNARTLREAFPSVSAYFPRMAAPSVVSLPSAPLTVSENAGTAVVEILRTGALDKAATVEFATVPSGARRAVAGADYTRVIRRVQFAVGEDRKQVEITIKDNATYDNDPTAGQRQFSAVLRFPEAASVGNDELVIRIADNEPTPTPTPVPTATPSSGEGGGGGSLSLSLLAGLLLIRRLLRR